METVTTYVNFCWGLGQVIGIGVIKSMLPRNDEWSYKIPYALQWMWPVPLLIGILLAPEVTSPPPPSLTHH